MCLILKRNESPKIAEEDIVCHKLLLCGNKEDTFLTIQMRHEVNITEPLYGMGKEDSSIMTFNKKDVRVITSGFIHTFQDWDGLCEHYANSDVYIIECIIPKGTEYYEGVDAAFDKKCFASKMILFKTDTITPLSFIKNNIEKDEEKTIAGNK